MPYPRIYAHSAVKFFNSVAFWGYLFQWKFTWQLVWKSFRGKGSAERTYCFIFTQIRWWSDITAKAGALSTSQFSIENKIANILSHTNRSDKHFPVTQPSTSTKHTHPDHTLLQEVHCSEHGQREYRALVPCKVKCVDTELVTGWQRQASDWAATLGDSALGQLPSHPNSAICFACFECGYYNHAQQHHVFCVSQDSFITIIAQQWWYEWDPIVWNSSDFCLSLLQCQIA